jgi:biotin synthase
LNFAGIVSRSLSGEPLTRDDARAILTLPDEQVPELLQAAFEVRKAAFGKRVKLCMLQNARSGLCPEDCHYCSQSSVSSAKIDKYPLMDGESLLDGAKRAAEAGATRYCMVTSGRGPTDEEIDQFCDVTRPALPAGDLPVPWHHVGVAGAQAQRIRCGLGEP